MQVPNAPCGVESTGILQLMVMNIAVPNAPCGVERFFLYFRLHPNKPFLMHRVELKELLARMALGA